MVAPCVCNSIHAIESSSASKGVTLTPLPTAACQCHSKLCNIVFPTCKEECQQRRMFEIIIYFNTHSLSFSLYVSLTLRPTNHDHDVSSMLFFLFLGRHLFTDTLQYRISHTVYLHPTHTHASHT